MHKAGSLHEGSTIKFYTREDFSLICKNGTSLEKLRRTNTNTLAYFYSLSVTERLSKLECLFKQLFFRLVSYFAKKSQGAKLYEYGPVHADIR